MALKLMYITNDTSIARIADECGVDWIFIDLEIIGKEQRQGHLDTVISKHSIENVKKIKNVLNKSKLLVRVNPIHENSKEEIDRVIQYGADIVMLPFFKTNLEVTEFIEYVNQRAEVCLLLETPEAVSNLDAILENSGINYIHIGLNDLHLGLNKKFMFELLVDGTVENIINKLKKTDIKYGFGGIAQLGQGTLPAENIIIEHYRLGSSMVILSRSFYKSGNNDDYETIKRVFLSGIEKIRNFEKNILDFSSEDFLENNFIVKKRIDGIVSKIN